MKGKLLNLKLEVCYGEIGEYAFTYNGLSYYVGDIVKVIGKDEYSVDTIIVQDSVHTDKYFPMGFGSISYVEAQSYNLIKIKSWYELKDKEKYYDDVVTVRIKDEVKDTIAKFDLSESKIDGLIEALKTIHKSMEINDYAELELNLDTDKLKARVYSPSDRNFDLDI